MFCSEEKFKWGVVEDENQPVKKQNIRWIWLKV